MNEDTLKIIHALERTNIANESIIELFKSGAVVIDSMERVAMLTIAMGALYSAYTNEVLPLLKSQNIHHEGIVIEA